MNRYQRKIARLASSLAIALIIGTPVAATAQPSSATGHADPVRVDSIVAVVDSDAITRNELRDRIAIVENRLQQRGVKLPPRELLARQMLERMIVERAQIHMAKEAGIRVDDAMLDRTIAHMAEQKKKTLDEFRRQIERDGISYARFREEIRGEMIMQRLREKEVINKIQVYDSEIDNYLETYQGSASGAPQMLEEVRLAHILVRIPENASPEQIASRRARAEEVLRLVRSGGDFQQNAAIYSDADEATQGGDLGWRSLDRLPEIFSAAIKNLKPGEVSDIIKSPNGFHVLKIMDKRSSGSTASLPTSVQQTHARHILIRVNELVSADEARRKLVELKQRLDNKAAKFEDLAQLFSNDLSASKGGDLGWIYPGDTVPEFERAMNALKPGEISDPVETQFGFHLIQVLERKTDDVSKERQRKIARQAIRERKIEEATEEWLRQVRDRAYVEYRLDDR